MCPRRNQSRRNLRERKHPHNGIENFWSLLRRGLKGNLCQRRTVPPVPLPRRRGGHKRAFPTVERRDLDWGHGKGHSTQLPLVFPAIRESNKGADRGPEKRT